MSRANAPEVVCLYGCEGGWTRVTESYVDRHLAALPVETVPAERERMRRALADSVTPCPSCRPEQYERWREGHYAPDHTCPECRTAKRRTRAR